MASIDHDSHEDTEQSPTSAGSSDNRPAPARTRTRSGTALAVVGLVLVAIGVAATCVVAATYVSAVHHRDGCRQYGDWLTLATADPLGRKPAVLSKLSGSDVAAIRSQVAAFETQWNATIALARPPTNESQATLKQQEDALLAKWSTSAREYRTVVLARRGC